MKVLIIESDTSFAHAAAEALRARGAKAMTTEDGQEGMDLARAEAPTALILSVELGDRLNGGFSWCNRIKKDDDLKDIPLLLVSSLASEETFEQHRKLKTRADGYLLKPFPMDTLLDKVEAMLPHLQALPGVSEETPAGAAESGRVEFRWQGGGEIQGANDEDEAAGFLGGIPGANGEDEAAGFLGELLGANGEDEPLFPGAEAGSSGAPPSDHDPEDLDLEDLFSQDTEQFAANPIWDDVPGEQEEEPSPAPVVVIETVSPPPMQPPAASSGELRRMTELYRTASAEAKASSSRAQQLESLFDESQAEILRLESRLDAALEEAKEKSRELAAAEERAKRATEESGKELAKAEERARKAMASRDEARIEAERMREQAQASTSWKERAEDLEKTVATQRQQLLLLEKKLEQDEQVRIRARKAIAVAGELLGSLQAPAPLDPEDR